MTSIQTVALIFPALFSAVHPYWPPSLRVTLLMVRVLLLTKYVPFLVQVTFGSGSPLSLHVILDRECKDTDTDSSLRSGFSFGGTYKEKQKYIYLLITRDISVNNNLTLSVSFGYPGVLSYQTIAISMMMSMAIVLQIFLGCVVNCIRRILKLKSQTDLRQSPYGYFIKET